MLVPHRGRAAVAALPALLAAAAAHASLATSGFRAVGVAHARWPVSAMAVAPDGRLFVAVQATGQTSGTTPGQAEIRVYQSYATGDGALPDEGTLWATVDGVRATTTEEGLLGLALAPDFAASKLVYVYLTTTDEEVNQHVRVYRETASGVGEYAGTVATSLEPPAGSSARNGGALAFGADGCLYVGVGDSADRWNAQVLRGTDPIGGASGALCTAVCAGTAEYPARTTDNGAPNLAGKVLRFAVEGPSPAQPGPAAPLAAQPAVFAAGLRNPVGFTVHPLTGQLWVSERGDSQQAEIGVVDGATNHGWPCLEGSVINTGAASCLAGQTPDLVYANHPGWRRPLVTYAGNPVLTGLTAYTGHAYPAEFYGDLFYLLRDSARIHRIDLAPPCFLPHPAGVTPVAFHDSTSDGDFTVLYDVNGDGTPETVGFPNLVALAQGPDPLGRQVLYVAGKQGNGSALTDDSVIFRIEYATTFTPYDGPTGRIPDACFTDGVYSAGTGSAPYGWENPFSRPACLPPGGPCPGQPDGASCADVDPCNGTETCAGGICQRGAPPADGTVACDAGNACQAPGTCHGGACVPGPPLADGTACADGDPCNGFETCAGGVCRPGAGPAPLAVRSITLARSGALSLQASLRPLAPLAPSTTDTVAVAVTGTSGGLEATLTHPDTDPRWRRSRAPKQFRYQDRRGTAGGLTSLRLRKRGDAMQVTLRARRVALGDPSTVATRLVIGDQCFAAAPGCTRSGRTTRCR